MSIEWAHNALRKEVPAMKNSLKAGQAASTLGVSAVTGACLPGTVAFSLAQDSGVFAAARPTAHGQVMAAGLQDTRKKYQDMTLIAAANGDVSGSHPAWDPV